MDKKEIVSLVKVAFVAFAVVLTTDFVKQQIAKSNMSKPLKVTEE